MYVCMFVCFWPSLSFHRKVLLEDSPVDGDDSIRWQGLGVNQVSNSSSELSATVKSLIKSFDTGPQGKSCLIHESLNFPVF